MWSKVISKILEVVLAEGSEIKSLNTSTETVVLVDKDGKTGVWSFTELVGDYDA